MIYPILRMGHPDLMRVAQPVPTAELGSPDLLKLVEDLFETMQAEGGVGLAAPQAGIDKRLVVFGFEHNARYPEAPAVPRTVLINPVLTFLNDTREIGWEGCLSVPGLRGQVPRATRLRYQGVDAYGNTIDVEAEGFHARVVQHECDHLDGILYPARIVDFQQFGFIDALPQRT